MKITREQLNKIIKEELQIIIEEMSVDEGIGDIARTGLKMAGSAAKAIGQHVVDSTKEKITKAATDKLNQVGNAAADKIVGGAQKITTKVLGDNPVGRMAGDMAASALGANKLRNPGNKLIPKKPPMGQPPVKKSQPPTENLEETEEKKKDKKEKSTGKSYVKPKPRRYGDQERNPHSGGDDWFGDMESGFERSDRDYD